MVRHALLLGVLATYNQHSTPRAGSHPELGTKLSIDSGRGSLAGS